MDEIGTAMKALEKLRQRSDDAIKMKCGRVQVALIELQELVNKVELDRLRLNGNPTTELQQQIDFKIGEFNGR